MILIHARQSDFTTLKVIQWLIECFKKDILRINSIMDIVPTLQFNFDHKTSSLPFKSYYFNGGNPAFRPEQIFREEYQELNLQLSKRLFDDFISVFNASFDIDLEQKRIFGLNPFQSYQNHKIKALSLAKSTGLKIPSSEVINNKKALLSFLKKHGNIITKSITNGADFKNSEVLINGERTEIVTDKMVENLPQVFYPMLFQVNVKKQFEVRCFYFRDQFYSIAIFTYSESTNVDCRNRNFNDPNREVPFQLPLKIQSKLSNLMKQLGLNYGSIDLILGTDDEYYFLEVNESGQYGFVSTAGNFHIEKQIAQYLAYE
ncbi:MAG: hypothetical protein BGO31_02975 [Bacteroidetes bacterium 43-16]|nr:MAG: hypothetical protein BGO31_02975 [Bacteroidetes bacterium 43-16]